jgi:hypothetical protein
LRPSTKKESKLNSKHEINYRSKTDEPTHHDGTLRFLLGAVQHQCLHFYKQSESALDWFSPCRFSSQYLRIDQNDDSTPPQDVGRLYFEVNNNGDEQRRGDDIRKAESPSS